MTLKKKKTAGYKNLEIIFEDRWLLVVYKPSGLLSVGYPGFSGKTAQDLLTDMVARGGKQRVAVVHRLDRDTSGVMMFALSAEAKEAIMGDWQRLVTERTYRCVCERAPHAKPLPDSGTIDAPLAYNKYDVAFVPRKDDGEHLKKAEKAVTHYKVLTRGARYDLVECELETGRKNQIRAHMAHLGHPVAGDEIYGRAANVSETEKSRSPAPERLALHARVLAFTHPFTGELQRFEVDEPAFFATLVGKPVTSKPEKVAGRTASGPETGARRGALGGNGNSKGTEAGRAVNKPKVRAERREKRDEDGMPAAESLTPRVRPGKGRAPAAKGSRAGKPGGGSRFIPGK